jgi:hypothetical protein
MEMITELTDQQLAAIEEYRDRYFRQATLTEPADRDRAEKAALRLAEIGGVKLNRIEWRNSPEECASLFVSLRDSFRDSLLDSIDSSLMASLRASLRASFKNSLFGSLMDSLLDSIWDSLGDSLRASLGYSLKDSLWDSFTDSLWDTGLIAFYTYVVEQLGVEISDANRELLGLHNEIAASCFAVWILPGTAILCERPERVEIEDGKLVGIAWRGTEGEEK